MSTETLNSLSRASSSYLRSAMHQPIHWLEWGDEAFAAAKRENKPILLDIGAVWCHWCHVMDRESYESPEIAQIINERFVAIKVDRDERPDIDGRYQVAVSAITGQGGWPLTAFLTPDGKPYYGGTYFPPEDHYGRPSFKRVLLAISDAFHEKNSDVMEQAQMVEGALSRAESFAGRQGEVSADVIQDILQSILNMYDERNGGFGSAPKFPHPAALDLIIDQYVQSCDEKLREVFVATLERMASGGVYDQLAGGFHRYSVDERWVVPHFEKMCYDNSELLKNYVHAYQATGSEFFAVVARDIIRWMDEWLSDRERAGFYASQDADYSMDDDGDYFTWTRQEAEQVLDTDEVALATLYYDIHEIGEMHHNPAKNVLYVRSSAKEAAEKLGKTEQEVQQFITSAKKKLYAARLRRPTPYVDKTMYVGWNAMCVSAYLDAARVLGLDDARRFALRSLDRLLAEGWHDDRGLMHVITYSDPSSGKRSVPGMLDDYVFSVIACLDAYETTSDLTYFYFAQKIGDAMIQRFYDASEGAFFDSEHRTNAQGVLGTPRKPFQDSPTPSGNATAAIGLLRLYGLTGNEGYREKAGRTLGAFAAVAGQYGLFAAMYGIAAVWFTRAQTQVVVLEADAEAAEMTKAAVAPFQLGKSVITVRKDEALPQKFPPALEETVPALSIRQNDNTSVAVVCREFSCLPPVTNAGELSRLLSRSSEVSQTEAQK